MWNLTGWSKGCQTQPKDGSDQREVQAEAEDPGLHPERPPCCHLEFNLLHLYVCNFLMVTTLMSIYKEF